MVIPKRAAEWCGGRGIRRLGRRDDRLSVAMGESFGKTLTSEMGEWFENHLERWIASSGKLNSIDSYYVSKGVLFHRELWNRTMSSTDNGQVTYWI